MHTTVCWNEETTVCRILSSTDPKCSFTTSSGTTVDRPRRYRAHTRRRPPGNTKIAFPGGHRRGVTPVPIPNTEVKPSTADGTAWETAWESRSLPGFFLQGPSRKRRAFFSVRLLPQQLPQRVQVVQMVRRRIAGKAADCKLASLRLAQLLHSDRSVPQNPLPGHRGVT
jgi:hypothetical protein